MANPVEPLPSAYGRLPDELGPGATTKARVFERLMRPWTYQGGRPALGRRMMSAVAGLSLALPAIERREAAADGSEKLVLRLADDHLIETVVMPRAHLENPRTTLCLSSQVGCAMGCTFCATGRMGLLRDLDAGDIVAQVLVALLARTDLRGHDLNLVFMGMGEPLANLSAVERAVAVLCHEAGLGIAPRRITVSTSGLVPGIERLARMSPRPLLAVSLNDTTSAGRRRTMPIEDVHGLDALVACLARYPLRPRERILVEYVLRAGDNDTRTHARQLAAIAARFPSTVNVIPLNEHDGTTSVRPGDDHVKRFCAWLYEDGCRATTRRSRGPDVLGACGQLIDQARRGQGRGLSVVAP